MARRKLPKNIPVKLPEFNTQPVLIRSGDNTDWSHEFYKIKEIHDKGYRGKGVTIAVLDTGVDLTHDSFQKAVDEGRLRALDGRVGGNDPIDRNFHGTWVCSRYISDGNDVLGFSPDCNVISIKVLNDNGSGNLDSIIRGIDIALAEGADIISTSLGWPNRVSDIDASVIKVNEANKVWISAAGNDGSREDIDYPALYNDVFSVGSLNSDIQRALHSDYGKDLDLYGSGELVKGAWKNNSEAYLSGTSMGTPSIGGLMALIWNKYLLENGAMTREGLKKIAKCL